MSPTEEVHVRVFEDDDGIRVSWADPENGGELGSFGRGIPSYQEAEEPAEEVPAEGLIEDLIRLDFDGYQYWFVELEAVRYLNRVRGQFTRSQGDLTFKNLSDAQGFCQYLRGLGPTIYSTFKARMLLNSRGTEGLYIDTSYLDTGIQVAWFHEGRMVSVVGDSLVVGDRQGYLEALERARIRGRFSDFQVHAIEHAASLYFEHHKDAVAREPEGTRFLTEKDASDFRQFLKTLGPDIQRKFFAQNKHYNGQDMVGSRKENSYDL